MNSSSDSIVCGSGEPSSVSGVLGVFSCGVDSVLLDLAAGCCSKEAGALRFRNVEGVLDMVVLNAGSRRVETTAPAYKGWRGQGGWWAIGGPL